VRRLPAQVCAPLRRGGGGHPGRRGPVCGRRGGGAFPRPGTHCGRRAARGRVAVMIEVVHTIADARQRVAAARAAGWRIGLVPTMGALHEGHASLIRRSVAAGEYTVVSIFVNPLQFGPGEDFEQYPRTLDADREVAASCGAHLIFAPSQSEMYPREQLTFVEVERLT